MDRESEKDSSIISIYSKNPRLTFSNVFDIFKRFGTVIYIHRFYNKHYSHPLPRFFLCYVSPKSAEDAIDSMDRTSYNGYILNVTHSFHPNEEYVEQLVMDDHPTQDLRIYKPYRELNPTNNPLINRINNQSKNQKKEEQRPSLSEKKSSSEEKKPTDKQSQSSSTSEPRSASHHEAEGKEAQRREEEGIQDLLEQYQYYLAPSSTHQQPDLSSIPQPKKSRFSDLDRDTYEKEYLKPKQRLEKYLEGLKTHGSDAPMDTVNEKETFTNSNLEVDYESDEGKIDLDDDIEQERNSIPQEPSPTSAQKPERDSHSSYSKQVTSKKHTSSAVHASPYSRYDSTSRSERRTETYRSSSARQYSPRSHYRSSH